LSYKQQILFIGGVNFKSLPQGGEEFKNRLLVHEISKIDIDLTVLDTNSWRINPKLWLKLIRSVFFKDYNKIIISASSNSTNKLLAVVYYLRPKVTSRIIYFILGGFAPEAIVTGIYNQKYYKSLANIVVQGKLFAETLRSNGFNNVCVIPNFKSINNVLDGLKVKKCYSTKSFKFVFISTISKEKGVDLIFDSIEYLSRVNEDFEFSVDFYGPIKDSYKEKFYQRLEKNKNTTRYCGYIDFLNQPLESYQKLNEYYALIFPSSYKGEGFSGVILDAYIAGLPVIVSDWKMNGEIVKHGVNGVIMNELTIHGLINAIVELLALDYESIVNSNLMYSREFDVEIIFKRDILPLLH